MVDIFYTDKEIPQHLQKVIDVFNKNSLKIDSEGLNVDLSSNEVLDIVRNDLENISYIVEGSFQHKDKIVFKIETKYHDELQFHADAYQISSKTIIEVEAGRAVVNYQFLKDLFQACMMYDVDYLVIAVRNNYSGNPDFQNVITFFDTLYASGRLQLPLKGILIVGY